jgi:hypothetical protein
VVQTINHIIFVKHKFKVWEATWSSHKVFFTCMFSRITAFKKRAGASECWHTLLSPCHWICVSNNRQTHVNKLMAKAGLNASVTTSVCTLLPRRTLVSPAHLYLVATGDTSVYTLMTALCMSSFHHHVSVVTLTL